MALFRLNRSSSVSTLLSTRQKNMLMSPPSQTRTRPPSSLCRQPKMMPDHVPERIAPVGARRVGFVEHRGRLAIAVELPANLFQPAALHRLTKLLALRLPPCD